MAYVRPNGNRIEVRIKLAEIRRQPFTTTIGLAPTKSNLKAAKRQADKARARLESGESWESVRAWLRGESHTAAGTLGYYAQHLLDHADTKTSTAMSDESTYDRYWAVFDQRPVNTLVQTELQAHLSAFKVSRKTKRNAVSVLSRIFALAKQDRVLVEAPTDGWTIKKGQRREPDPYTAKERDTLLEHLDPWPIAQSYFTMAFHTGMRTGELLGLEWRSMDRPHVVVEQARVRREITSIKTEEIRRVRLPGFIWDQLDANPTKFQRSFVFLTPENHPFRDADWLMDKWNRAHKSARIRKRPPPYPWRHTYISLGLAAGVSQIWMSKQTGHDIVTMRTHYARWIPGNEDADAAELEKLYG